MGDSILPLASRQTGNLHTLSLLRISMIYKQTFTQGRYPQISLFIDSHSKYRRLLDDTIQIAIAATELLLVIVIYKKSFIVGTHPDVLTRILEYLCYIRLGHRGREAGIALATKGVGKQVEFKEPVMRCAEQDIIVIKQTGSLQHAAVGSDTRCHLRTERNELVRFNIVDNQGAIARSQQQIV